VDEHAIEEAMREDYEEQLRRVRREVEELERREREFQKEFKVVNSNLILYEESFNEEVFLRLKFEEKINQVYSSYDELKEKFESLRQELAYKT
jgi:chromosome segregation ATPase